MKQDIAKIGREMVFLGTYDAYDAEDIIEVLKAADDLYFNDQQSFLEDTEYDALRKYAEQVAPYHSYFTGVGSEVRGGKVKLPYQMGSLDQVDVGEITDWVGNWGLQRESVVITDKLDGTSAMVIYGSNGELQIAYSRGNGVEGADITRHIKRFASLPSNVGEKMVIRGEVILTKSAFEELRGKVTSRGGTPYKNARNMVAGLMNAEKNDPIVYQYLHFVAYDRLGDTTSKRHTLASLTACGFMIPYATVKKGAHLTDDTLAAYLRLRREMTDYEIDGLVIDADSERMRKRMNPTRETLNPAYAIKYKVADASNLVHAEVIGIEWNVSKHGYLKPRIKIKPVELVGVTVQYCTGFNAKFVYDNKIQPGSIIAITRSGDVIPHCTRVVDPGPLK